jgi:hypothetical protein
VPRGTGARAGFGLLELCFALLVLIVGLGGLVKMLLGDLALHERSRSLALATHGSRSVLERLGALPLAEAFASYNAEPGDDPAGGAPGSAFAVAGLEPDPADADGQCGEVLFPTPSGLPGVLSELGGSGFPGGPFDLNLDGDALDADVTAQAAILPVVVRVRWRSQSGAIETYELKTVF